MSFVFWGEPGAYDSWKQHQQKTARDNRVGEKVVVATDALRQHVNAHPNEVRTYCHHCDKTADDLHNVVVCGRCRYPHYASCTKRCFWNRQTVEMCRECRESKD